MSLRPSDHVDAPVDDAEGRDLVGEIAQLGVIVSTFSLAARQRSFLWGVAASAGVAAVAFAGYVYLFV